MFRTIISCRVFEPYVRLFETERDVKLDIRWIDVKQHDQPKRLQELIQKEIDTIQDADEILVLYGICGNALVGLKPKNIPLALVRVHDCCPILLGSKKRFKEVFGHRLSQRWGCESYSIDDQSKYDSKSPEYLKLAKEYGEENAEYVFSILHPETSDGLVYINFGSELDRFNLTQLVNEKVEIADGQTEFLFSIIDGTSDELLILNPDETIEPLYDLDIVFEKKIN